MVLKVTIIITPRKTVLHPESQTLSKIVKERFYDGVEKISMGNFITYEGNDISILKDSVKELMERQLYSKYSPLLYNFDIKIEEKAKD